MAVFILQNIAVRKLLETVASLLNSPVFSQSGGRNFFSHIKTNVIELLLLLVVQRMRIKCFKFSSLGVVLRRGRAVNAVQFLLFSFLTRKMADISELLV